METIVIKDDGEREEMVARRCADPSDEGDDEISVMRGSCGVSGPPEKVKVARATGVRDVVDGVAVVLLVLVAAVVAVFRDDPRRFVQLSTEWPLFPQYAHRFSRFRHSFSSSFSSPLALWIFGSWVVEDEGVDDEGGFVARDELECVPRSEDLMALSSSWRSQ